MTYLLGLAFLFASFAFAQTNSSIEKLIKSTPCGTACKLSSKGCVNNYERVSMVVAQEQVAEKDHLAQTSRGDFIHLAPDGKVTLHHCPFKERDPKSKTKAVYVNREIKNIKGNVYIKKEGFQDINPECTFNNIASVKYTINYRGGGNPVDLAFLPLDKKKYSEENIADALKTMTEDQKTAWAELCQGASSSIQETPEKNESTNGVKKI